MPKKPYNPLPGEIGPNGSMVPPSPPMSPIQELFTPPKSRTGRPGRLIGRILGGKPEPTSQPSSPSLPKPKNEAQKRRNSLVARDPRSRSRMDDAWSDRAPSQSPSSKQTPESRGRSMFNDTEPRPTYDGPLPGLQMRSPARAQFYEPLTADELDPDSFDLVAPSDDQNGPYESALEKVCDVLFSEAHLTMIFSDYTLLERFTRFIRTCRPKSVPLLDYYMKALKSLAARTYADSLAEELSAVTYAGDSLAFTQARVARSSNELLKAKIAEAFHVLAAEELPSFITHVWMEMVAESMRRKVAGTLPGYLSELSEGLAETFCLTDPSKHDNPIIFASEEFCKTTQYATSYAIGRNCRFLQGPKTSDNAVSRLRKALHAGKEVFEVFLNYRRNGSPFMNLLMCTPLKDRGGRVRYFLGAQVDVSGLALEFAGLEYLQDAKFRKNSSTEDAQNPDESTPKETSANKNLRDFTEMLSDEDLELVSKHGGRMHHPNQQSSRPEKRRVVISPEYADDRSSSDTTREDDVSSMTSGMSRGTEGGPPSLTNQQRRRMSSPNPPLSLTNAVLTGGGNMGAMYEHYVLVRPAPSLRIVFASPALRIPGLLQSSLLDRIGGSPRVRDQVLSAFDRETAVTANVRWISRPTANDDFHDKTVGRPRWLHATPLLSSAGAVGVWMVVLFDDDGDGGTKRAMHSSPRPIGIPSIQRQRGSQPWDEEPLL